MASNFELRILAF